MTTLYRYEIDYKNIDDDTHVRLHEYPVIRETENSYFISCIISKPPKWTQKQVEKRVSKNSMNTYAYDTKEKAKEHFITRTTQRLNWYRFWLGECKKGLELIKND